MRRKVALITGGGGSIGMASARILGSRGWRTMLADLDEPERLPEGAVFQKVDVRDPDSIQRAFDAASALGDLTSVVVSHGVLLAVEHEAIDEERLELIIDVNLKGVARTCAAAARALKDGGSIVLIGSLAGSLGRFKAAVGYQASKAGVDALARSYAVHLAERGIRVNSVIPGFVESPMKGEGFELRQKQGGDEKLKAASPMGRLIRYDEIGSVIAFLCSDEASTVSRAVIPVDQSVLAF